MRRELHNAAGDSRLVGKVGGQFAVDFETQHIGRRRTEQFGRFGQRYNAALLEHGNAATQGLRLFKIVRGQQHRAALFVELGDELPQRLPQFDVHARCRLVQHDHLRFVNQCLRHQHAPFHAP